MPPITKLLTNGAHMTCPGGHINRVAAKKIDEAGGRHPQSKAAGKMSGGKFKSQDMAFETVRRWRRPK